VRDVTRKKLKPSDTSTTAVIPEVVPAEVELLPESLAGEMESAVAEILPLESDQAIELLPADDELAPAPPLRNKKEGRKREARKEIVPYDPLRAYLREIARLPHLTREEEHALAVNYHQNKDIKAAYKLVSSNLWLVVKLAREYERAARNLLDVVQEGNIGLMEAVKNFDPYRGVRFPSYAVWWIRAYIVRYLIANWRMVKIGTTQAQRKLFFNLKKEKEKLEREGFFPAPKLLAEKLDVKESEVIEMEQRLGSADVSVDAPLDEGGESNLHSVLPADQENQEDLLAGKQIQALLTKSMAQFESSLSDRERTIFRERMLNEEKATLQEVSDKISVSRERVRQIEGRLREKLKRFLAERLGSSVDEVME
jgi:RNA polymerase sigma-32 factor